jgi:hypothetical protein
MASKDGKEPRQEGEEGPPPVVVAQAEAAMYANLKQRRRGLTRSKTDVMPDVPQLQTTNQTSGSGESSITR